MSVLGIYEEIAFERDSATSMERYAVDDMNRLAILTEEIGEVAKEFNEARHRGGALDLAALRRELIQVGAMAAAWADRIPT